MFEKAYIVEDTKSDAKELIESLSIFIEKENIVVIDHIDDALGTILNTDCTDNQIVAFIDILWHREMIGIKLANSIKRKKPNIKLVAYTKTEDGAKLSNEYSIFDAFIDKRTNDPHPLALKISDINDQFLEKLHNGRNFMIKTNANLLDSKITSDDDIETKMSHNSYLFTIQSKIKTSAQFVFVDFAKFSSKDETLQLNRFEDLRNAMGEIAADTIYNDIDLVFLPTGDGVVVGIFTDIIEPFAVNVSFTLLELLRKTNLQNELRIGVHFGSVFRLIGSRGEQQLIGTGINKAARIEAASQPGRILVSDEYYTHFLEKTGGVVRELTIDEHSTVYQIKDDKFHARFVSKGQIGK